MNVYDFDGTIYDGDSTVDFYFFCLKKHPVIALCIPWQIVGAIKYKLKRINKTEFKEQFYCFFNHIKDSDVKKFWDSHERKIKQWYIEKHSKNDVIISASPYFLLSEICNRLEINNLIASDVRKTDGKYTGINCYGEEKVRRFYSEFPDDKIDNFFSDSYSDQPLANISNHSFLVNGNDFIPWK